MNVKSISYQKSFVIGPYLQEKIGVEIELLPTDDWDEAFKSANDMVNAWHKPPVEDITHAGMNVMPIEPKDTKTSLIEDMNKCPTIPELETFLTLAKSNPDLNAAYNRKYAELLNQ
jgi:hypothetical protein